MGRIFIDGFECGHHGCWDGRSSVTNVEVIPNDEIGSWVGCGSPLRGDYVLRIRGNHYLNLDLSRYITPTNELYFKWRWALDAMSAEASPRYVFQLRDTLGDNLNVVWVDHVGDYLEVTRGGTVIGTGSTSISPNVWYLVELYMKIGESPNGAFELKLNGSTEIADSGIDTQAGAVSNIGYCRLYNSSVFVNRDAVYDDFAVDDSTWCNDGRIIAMVPNAEGDESDWDWVNKGSDTESWEAVDEIPTDNSDYWHTNVINELHSVHLEPAPADDMSVINGVEVCLDARKSGIPNVQNLEHLLRDNGWGTPNQLSGVDQALQADANKTLCYCWAQNPGTVSAWAKSDLANLQIGVKSKA